MIDREQFEALTGAHSLLAKHGYVLTYHPVNGKAYLMTQKQSLVNAWHAVQHLDFKSLIDAIHRIVGDAPPGQYHIPEAAFNFGPILHLFDVKYEYGFFVENQILDIEDQLDIEAFVKQELPGVPYRILIRHHHLNGKDAMGWVFVFKEKEHVAKLELARGHVVDE